MKLNIGSGDSPLTGYINVDVEEKVKPDVIHDISKAPLPFEDNSADEIMCVHNLEHIKFQLWPFVLTDFHRVLKQNGMLVLAYPEFEICAKYFIENNRGQREFWRACLYGRQLWPGDYHVAPVITSELKIILERIGFRDIKSIPSPGDEYYTTLKCTNGLPYDKQDLLKDMIFKDHEVELGRFKKKELITK